MRERSLLRSCVEGPQSPPQLSLEGWKKRFMKQVHWITLLGICSRYVLLAVLDKG